MGRLRLCIACGRKARGSWGGQLLCEECGRGAAELLASGARDARTAALLLIDEDRLQELEWLGVAGTLREDVREARDEHGLDAREARILGGMATVSAELGELARVRSERLEAAREKARRENAARTAALAEKGETEEQAAARAARRRELNAALGR